MAPVTRLRPSSFDEMLGAKPPSSPTLQASWPEEASEARELLQIASLQAKDLRLFKSASLPILTVLGFDQVFELVVNFAAHSHGLRE
jgi:hypothetical protein